MKSKKVTKKLLSLIIASIMIVTMLPVSAFAAESDVMIEDQAEAIVEEAADVSGEVVEEAAEVPDTENSEDAAIVEGVVDELEEADPEELTGYTETLSFTAQGVPSGSKMHFDAQLTGLSVSAVVPAKRAAKGSVMTADIVDVSAYEDAIAKKNYGKSIAGLYGLELHFYDKKGKEIKHINTSDITVTVDGLEASSYFIGRIDNKVKKIQRGTEPTFTFTEKKAYTYVIAGLEDDGLVRASGEADGDGNKRFNLNDENVNIEVVAPEDAFADGVAMEANDVTNGAYEDGEEALVGASSDEVVAAYEISFYNEDGDEQQPSKGVAVTINTTLDMTKSYKLIHIADDGTSNEVEGAKFTENGVEFVADSFSVYAVVWKDAGDNECSATIHWGTYEGDNFEEFDSITTIDTNASSVDLAVNVDEYYYAGARYKESESDDGVRMVSSVIKKANNGGWTVDVAIVNDDDSVTETTIPVEDGSHIYLYYAEKGGGGYTPPGPVPATLNDIAPETGKQVTKNSDGTYTIRLDIEGHATEDTKIGANVIVMLDMTYSMRQNDMTTQSGGRQTRIAAAKSALLTLIDALDPGYDAQNPDKNLVNFTLATFGNTTSTTTVRTWTQNRSRMESAVNGLSNDPGALGTNWQGGLQGAEVLAEAANTNADLKKNPTYVIFVTDGAPNCWQGHTSSNTGNDLDPAALPYAQTAANSLTQDAILYGVFCGPASGYANLDNLVRGAHGADTINGVSTAALKEAFSKIAGQIVAGMAASNVTVDDGIPALSNVSANVTAGEAGGFKYYITPKNGSETEWTKGATGEDDPGAPGASYDQSNGVTWDLGEVGELKDGWLYSIEFTVWPSQKAYDTIADLNNGKITMSDAELEAAGIAKPAGEGQPYTLKTNTHLNTTFTDPSGHVYDVVAEDVTSEAMILPTETISVRKLWHNWLDSRANTDIDGLQLVLSRDGEDYLEFDVDATTNWEKNNIFISCGQIANGVVKEKGHDYYVTEKAREDLDKTEYWEVNSPYYHPMVVDGAMKLYIRDDSASTAAFEVNGHKYVEPTGAAATTLSAINERVSWLNLTKTVEGDDIPENALFQYKVKITEVSEGAEIYFSVRGGGENYRNDIETSANVTKYTDPSDNNTYYVVDSGDEFTLKIKAGWNARFLNLESGTTYSIEEIDMDPGFVLDRAEVKETLYSAYNEVAAGYPKEANSSGSTFEDTSVTDKGVINGKIHQTNTDYTATYNNKYLGVFYVYHSGDCSVERYPMAVNGVAYGQKKKFDIHALTATDKLYGGYYSDYAGKSSGFNAAAAKALDYSGEEDPKDKGGTAYSYDYIKDSNKDAWSYSNGYDVDGTAMVPQKDTVYYLKEVPDGYLRPYTHYTYFLDDYRIGTAWTITDTDDLCYSKAGFMVRTDNKVAKIVASMTIAPENRSYSTVTLTAGKVFKPKGVLDGWLGYADITGYIDGSKAVIQQYWETKDGIEVFGVKQRELTFTADDSGQYTKFGIVKSDTDYSAS